MKRRGRRIFWVCIILFFNFIFEPWGTITFADDVTEKFLLLPLAADMHVLQGWVYTVKVNGNLTHGAMDYDCELGQSVYASADGLAMSSRQVSAILKVGYGDFVFIKHDNGYATLYGHLNKINEKITRYRDSERSNTEYTQWVKIKQGEYIGQCGSSGTDNVHLHFEVTSGAYAVGRVDSYDLYKTKEYYPPNSSYVAMGSKHLWKTEPPEYVESGLVREKDVNTDKKGIVDRIKELVIGGNKDISELKVDDSKNGTGIMDLSFVDEINNVSVRPMEDAEISVAAKNVGNIVWKKEKVSLNVVGGAEQNKIFRHTSWITNLRPTLLNTAEVEPGDAGTFTFSIPGLQPGSYILKLMVVETGTWKQIGDEELILNISVVEEKKDESVLEIKKPLEGVVQGVKDVVGSVVETIVDVIESIPRFFGGVRHRSHGDKEQSLREVTIGESAQSEELVIPDEFGDTGDGGKVSGEVIFNEIAWSGSSKFCADREWIELYNSSDEPRSLEGWSIDSNAAGITTTVYLSGIIEGKDYYLISDPNTFTSFITPDVVLQDNLEIQDTGGTLILKNQGGIIIDEINQNSGWLGGDAGEFPHTLERDSFMVSSSWHTSDSVRYGVSSGTCGQITGSPRLANNGYAFISDEALGFYPIDTEGNISLSKEENPHIFSTFTIRKNKKMIVHAGVVFVGLSNDAQIVVEGEIDLLGNEDHQVIVTSKNDRAHVSSSQIWWHIFSSSSPRSGDWQNILVKQGGKLDIENSIISYGGNRYGASASCQACAHSQMISNEGGVVYINKSEISYGYDQGTIGSKPDSMLYTEGGEMSLYDVEIHHGKRALHSDGDTKIISEELVIHDFDSSDKVVFFAYKMPVHWENITYTDNTPSHAYSPTLVVTSTYTLKENQRFQFGTITVAPSGTLNIYHSDLYATEIKINGSLYMEEGVISGGTSTSSTFSYIFFSPGSSGALSHVNMHGGGYVPSISAYPFVSSRPYMLWIEGASVSISDSKILDSRRTGGIVVVKNGNIVIIDSEIGWTTGYAKQVTWKDYGIVGNNQSTIRLENIQFEKMDYVVELNQGSTMTYDRMTTQNFIDLYKPDLLQKNWYPQNLFPFQLW